MKLVLTPHGMMEASAYVAAAEKEIPNSWGPLDLIQRGLDIFLEKQIDKGNEYIAQAGNNLIDKFYDFISWLFENLTSLITTFPISLLTNPEIRTLQGIFILYSVVMVIVLSMIEGMKALFGIRYTNISTLFGRTFIAFIGAGLTLPALIWVLNCANLLVEVVLQLGKQYLGNSIPLGDMIRTFSADSTMNFFAGILFLIVFLYFISGALMKLGRRWFDLIINAVVSPFAWAAYVTDGTMKHLTSWFHSTGKIIMTNIVYAFYVLVISTIIMAPGEVQTGTGLFARMLLLIGGLYRLANPPAWIQSMDTGGTGGKAIKKVVDMILFKKFKKVK